MQALAQPELTMTAWARPAAACARDRMTGAAATLLVVKTAAAAHGAVETSRARSFFPAPCVLMPA